jgi:hypothetical protein
LYSNETHSHNVSLIFVKSDPFLSDVPNSRRITAPSDSPPHRHRRLSPPRPTTLAPSPPTTLHLTAIPAFPRPAPPRRSSSRTARGAAPPRHHNNTKSSSGSRRGGAPAAQAVLPLPPLRGFAVLGENSDDDDDDGDVVMAAPPAAALTAAPARPLVYGALAGTARGAATCA